MNLCNNSGTGVSPVRFKMAIYFAARNTGETPVHYQHENFNTD